MDNITLDKVLKFMFKSKESLVNYYIISKTEFSQVSFCKKFTFIICHTDVSPAGHWVVYCVRNINNKFCVQYFDSLGNSPTYYGLQFPLKNCSIYSINRVLQHASSESCGIFVLYFIHYRIKQCSYMSIVNSFSSSTIENEKKVRRFYTLLLQRMLHA